ncbi:hypothetical protein ACWKSP_22170 [Micromonosporaceae bacterium Da 78-11]
MTALFYVVEVIGDTCIRIEPGHLTEADAYFAACDRWNEADAHDPAEYVVEPGHPDGPGVYVRPVQHGRDQI